jgi:hypothetical protein
MGWNYSYNNFNESTGRATYAQNLYDATLDRSYDYDQVGRLIASYAGSDARAHIGTGSGTGDGPYAQLYGYDVWQHCEPPGLGRNKPILDGQLHEQSHEWVRL